MNPSKAYKKVTKGDTFTEAKIDTVLSQVHIPNTVEAFNALTKLLLRYYAQKQKQAQKGPTNRLKKHAFFQPRKAVRDLWGVVGGGEFNYG